MLGGGDGADFSAAAGIDGVEFGGYDVGRWSRELIGGPFVGEEARDEVFLEAGRCTVGNGSAEVEVGEGQGPHWGWRNRGEWRGGVISVASLSKHGILRLKRR